jgi:iron complex outermembrane receptor protein
LTVEGQSERANGPVPGFVAHRSATATKTDTPLLEAPQSISVIGRDAMDSRNVTTINEALHYTAGVATYYSNDTRNDSFRIRGFDAAFFYLDGTRLPAISGRGLDQWRVDPYQLERIEVLKGPSSVLYGQGEPGGVLSMVSKMPTAYARGQVDLLAGSYKHAGIGVDTSGPLDPEGHWLYRFIAAGNYSANQVDSVEGTRTLVAPALTFRPDGATALTIMASYLHDDTMDSNNFLPYVGTVKPNDFGFRIRTSLPTSNPAFENYDKTQNSVSAIFEHSFDPNWTVRQNVRFAHLDLNNQALFGIRLQADQQTLQRAAMNLRSSYDVIDLDQRLTGRMRTGPVDHTLLFGFNATHQTYADNEGYRYRGYALDLYNPIALSAPVTKPPFNDTQMRQRQGQYGLYAQDQMTLDRLVLVASGRSDWVASDIADRLAVSRTRQDDEAFTGRVGLLYRLDGGVAPYISYATSFRPLLGLDVDHRPFKPLDAVQYEAGVKVQPEFLNATLSAAVFDLRQNNTPTDAPDGRFGSVQLGQTRSRGFEVEVTAQATESIRLLGAYTRQDVAITRAAPGDPTLGKAPTATPRNLASLWADYTLRGGPLDGLGFALGGQYVGASYADLSNTLKVDPFLVLDAAVHYEIPDWRFVLSAQNLLDETYVARCGLVTRCQYGQRLNVLFTAQYSW